MLYVGVGLVVCALACGALAALGLLQVVSGVVLGALCLVLSIPCFVLGNVGRGFDRDAARVRELPTRGRRVSARVVDALPMTSPHGGPVFQRTGAQMVLHVELDRGAAGTERATLHLVESSELARGRIGSTVTVLEHPDDAGLRALEGFLPNGLRAQG